MPSEFRMQPRPDHVDSRHESGFPLPLPDSVQLAQCAKAGDEAALDELFKRYYERVYRIVRIRLGARVRGVIDARATEKAARAEASSEIRSLDAKDHSTLVQWLANIAERRILAGEQAVPEPAPGMRASPSSSSSSVPVPASFVGNPELKEIYDSCVERLPPQRRELVLLREYARCSWSQIARELRLQNEDVAKDEYRRAQLEIAGLLRKRLRG
jgi:RNA polymerase sigma-70 factor (ECF subfamily)